MKSLSVRQAVVIAGPVSLDFRKGVQPSAERNQAPALTALAAARRGRPPEPAGRVPGLAVGKQPTAAVGAGAAPAARPSVERHKQAVRGKRRLQQAAAVPAD